MRFGVRAAASLIVAACVGQVATPVLSQWRVSSSDSIGTGRGQVLLAADLAPNGSLYGQCSPNGEPSLYISVADNSSLSPLAPDVRLGTSTDGGEPVWAGGRQERRDGFMVTRWTDDLLARGVLNALVAAKIEVVFSIHRPAVGDIQMLRVAARSSAGMGATGAVLEFLDRCRILREAAASQPALPPLLPPSELFRQEPGTISPAGPTSSGPPGWFVEADPQLRLVVRTPDDLELVLTCGIAGLGTVSLESSDRQSFPAGRKSVAMLGFGIEGGEMPLALDPAPDRNGKAVLASSDPNVFALIALALVAASAEPEVEGMTIIVGATESNAQPKAAHIYIDGAAAPADRFYQGCVTR